MLYMHLNYAHILIYIKLKILHYKHIQYVKLYMLKVFVSRTSYPARTFYSCTISYTYTITICITLSTYIVTHIIIRQKLTSCYCILIANRQLQIFYDFQKLCVYVVCRMRIWQWLGRYDTVARNLKLALCPVCMQIDDRPSITRLPAVWREGYVLSLA